MVRNKKNEINNCLKNLLGIIYLWRIIVIVVVSVAVVKGVSRLWLIFSVEWLGNFFIIFKWPIISIPFVLIWIIFSLLVTLLFLLFIFFLRILTANWSLLLIILLDPSLLSLFSSFFVEVTSFLPIMFILVIW